MHVAAGLASLLDALSRCLDAESSRRLLDFRVGAPVKARIDALAEQANKGTLDSDERAGYEAMISAADFISLRKLKARRQLSEIPQ